MEKELRILMLEDLEDDAWWMDRVLTKEKMTFTRIRVDTKEEFIKALDAFSPDIILSDHSLPQFNSIEALVIARESKPDVPFIIVSGSVSEEFAVSCIKRGADDYILKSNMSRLPSAIRHAIDEYSNKKASREQADALWKKNGELTKINKELDSFVYGISHNLRSPLASVMGLVNIAKLDHNESNEAPDCYLDMIGQSTLKLNDTLKEILDYSQNLRTALETSEINLRQLCEESFDRLKYLKGSPEIEKQFDIQNEAMFYSDIYRLKIVLLNLLSNSIKFRDERKPNQFISIKASISAAHAVLSISDNGTGIDPNYISNVFDMFVRANESSDGAGLGLYVVKDVIEKLKGTIEIASSYGEWTRVDITLPNMNDKTTLSG